MDNLCLSSVETQDMVIVNSNPSLSFDFIKTQERFNRQSGFYVMGVATSQLVPYIKRA